jgi:DNA-binding response OmpR family regulator
MSRVLSILVAEDEFLLAMQVEALLTAAGWIVIGPASTLASAIELARSAACDCAVLDVNLRGERIDEAAAILAGRGVPFLFATGYGRDSIPAACRESAVILPKPFAEHDLLQAVKSLVAHLAE